MKRRTDLDQVMRTRVSWTNRTLYLVGEVDADMAMATLVALDALDATAGEIRVVLNSLGGNEPDGYAIYDALVQCRNRVVIEAYGAVMSIAAVIFQAGDWRRIAANAQFMIHNGEASLEKDPGQNEVLAIAERIKLDNERYYSILADASGNPVEVVEEWCHQETYFFATETVGACFADEVIPVSTEEK